MKKDKTVKVSRNISLPKILLLIISGLMILGQFQRISLFGNVSFYLFDVVIAAFVLITISSSTTTLKTVLQTTWGSLAKRFLQVVLLTFALAVFSHPDIAVFTGGLYLARLLLYMLFGLGLYTLVKATVILRREVSLLFLTITTSIAALGILQYVFVPDVRGLQYMGWDDHYLRVVSTLFDPVFAGLVMLLGAIFIGQKLLENNEHRWKILFIVCMLGVLLTYSRTNYLAFFAAISVFFFAFKKLRLGFVVSAGLLIFGIFLLPRPASEGTRLERLTSVTARISNASQTLRSMSPKTLLVGEGWYMANADRVTNNTMASISHSSSPDNSYLHVLQSTGILGLVVFAQLLAALFKTAKRVSTRSSLIAVAVAALFSQTFFYPWVLLYVFIWFWIWRRLR
jgi:hypothetical protein